MTISATDVYACKSCVLDSRIYDSKDLAFSNVQISSDADHVSMLQTALRECHSEERSGNRSLNNVGYDESHISEMADVTVGHQARFKSRDSDIPVLGREYSIRNSHIVKPHQELLDDSEDRSLPHCPPPDSTADTFRAMPSRRSRFQI